MIFMKGILTYLLIGLVIYFMFKLVYNLKINKINFEKFLIMFFIATLAFVALITDLLNVFSQLVGVSRPADFAVYVSVLLIFFLLFKLYLSVETNRSKISEMTQNYAVLHGLKDYKKFRGK